MSATSEPQYLLLWKGLQSGPFSLALIREKLGAGEISRMHQVHYNGRWIVLDEFLEKHGGDSEARRRAEAEQRETQLRRSFEDKLATERAQRSALEERPKEADERSRLSHLLPPQAPPVTPNNPISEEGRSPITPQPSIFRASSGRTTSFGTDFKLLLGIIGSALLILGVFCPIVSIPIIGGMNYFQNGKGDGTIVLVLAAGSAVLALARQFQWLWFTGGGSLGMLIFTFVRFQSLMKDAKRGLSSDLRGNPFAGAAEGLFDSVVQLQWGFAILVIGSVLVIAAAAIPKSNASKHT